MKNILLILGLLAMLASGCVLTGCALFQPAVPTTEMSGTLNGQRWSYKNPKQASATNIVVEVSTNGTARFSVGGLSSINDPQVVDKAYAGQAQVINALGAVTHQAIQDGVDIASKLK